MKATFLVSGVFVHRRHGQRSFVVANEEGDQLRRLFVAGIGRYLVDPVRRLVEALSRLVNGLGAATPPGSESRPVPRIRLRCRDGCAACLLLRARSSLRRRSRAGGCRPAVAARARKRRDGSPLRRIAQRKGVRSSQCYQRQLQSSAMRHEMNRKACSFDLS